jgi:phosphotransferase system HPr (HPr) family protein
MNGVPLQRTVIINNLQGLHMRPISAFVEMAGKFKSSVFVTKKGNGERINGKSPLSLLGLAAEKGTELILEVSGPDEQEALDALAQFLSTLNTEDLPGA